MFRVGHCCAAVWRMVVVVVVVMRVMRLVW